MITNKDEAFEHNSCKKLAQLSKVIFNMSMQNRDLNDELEVVSMEYEEVIKEIVSHFRSKAESITKHLINFRKVSIDNCCKQYGANYKALKADYASFHTQTTETLQKILQEGKDLQVLIQQFQLQTLQTASETLEAANSLETNLKPHGNRPTTALKRQINSFIQPILEKINEVQLQSDERIAKLRKKQSSLISQNKSALSKFLRQELNSRLPHYQEYNSKISLLHKFISSLHQQYTNVVKNHALLFKDRLHQKERIITDTKKKIIFIKKEIKTLQEREKTNVKARALIIKESQKQLAQLKSAHIASIDDITKQVHEQRHRRHKFRNSRSNFAQQHELEFKQQEELTNQDFEKEIQLRNSYHEEIATMLLQSENDTLKLQNSLNSKIEESLSRIQDHKELFSTKLQTVISDSNTFLENSSSLNQSILESLINIFNSTTSQTILNSHEFHKDDNEIILTLQNALSNNKIAFENELNSLNQSNAKHFEEIQANYLERQNQRREEKSNYIERRAQEKEKRSMELQKHFTEDLNFKKQQKADENCQNIKLFEAEMEQKYTNKEEIQAHELADKKINAKLQYATQQIDEKRATWEKKIQYIKEQQKNVQKTQRQLQRSYSTQSDDISNDYEIKIQIEQVHLQEAIDSLGKIYEEEENARACEIIDALRKVREVNNRTDDMVMRKKRELEQLQTNNKNNSESLQNQINAYRNNVKIDELQLAMKNKDNQRKNECKNLNKKYDIVCSNLQNEMTNNAKQFESEKIQIETASKNDDTDFEKETLAIQQEIQSIHNDVEAKKREISKTYEDKTIELKHHHEQSKYSVQNKLNAAKQHYDEAKNKNQAEIESKKKEYEKVHSQEKKLIQNPLYLSEIKSENGDQLRKMIELSDNHFEYLTEYYKQIALDPKENVQQLISIQMKSIQNLDSELISLFQQNQQTIIEGPDIIPEDPPEITARSIKSNRNISSRKENRNILNIDPKLTSKKSQPYLITPQFI